MSEVTKKNIKEVTKKNIKLFVATPAFGHMVNKLYEQYDEVYINNSSNIKYINSNASSIGDGISYTS